MPDILDLPRTFIVNFCPTESTEPGMDIFRRQSDGSWKIIRYLAYEE